MKIQADKTKTAIPWTKIGRKIVEFSENPEVLPRERPGWNLGSFQDALGNWLSGDAHNEGAPVVNGKLA